MGKAGKIRAGSGKEVARMLADFVNNYAADTEGFVDGILLEHRTLQQSVMKLFIDLATEMAKRDSHDLRNEDAVKVAKAIVALGPDVLAMRFI